MCDYARIGGHWICTIKRKKRKDDFIHVKVVLSNFDLIAYVEILELMHHRVTKSSCIKRLGPHLQRLSNLKSKKNNFEIFAN